MGWSTPCALDRRRLCRNATAAGSRNLAQQRGGLGSWPTFLKHLQIPRKNVGKNWKNMVSWRKKKQMAKKRKKLWFQVVGRWVFWALSPPQHLAATVQSSSRRRWVSWTSPWHSGPKNHPSFRWWSMGEPMVWGTNSETSNMVHWVYTLKTWMYSWIFEISRSLVVSPVFPAKMHSLGSPKYITRPGVPTVPWQGI